MTVSLLYINFDGNWVWTIWTVPKQNVIWPAQEASKEVFKIVFEWSMLMIV